MIHSTYRLLSIAFFLIVPTVAQAQRDSLGQTPSPPPPPVLESRVIFDFYPRAGVSLEDFSELIEELDTARKSRLLSLDKFLVAASDSATVVLDARSRDMYAGRHLAGAVNLPYTEFTVESLAAVIPDSSTRILIYCNNNFADDDRYFRSKRVGGNGRPARERGKTPRLLALNIPTHITLRGYGYLNVYELNELVKVTDKRLANQWGGSDPVPTSLRSYR